MQGCAVSHTSPAPKIVRKAGEGNDAFTDKGSMSQPSLHCRCYCRSIGQRRDKARSSHHSFISRKGKEVGSTKQGRSRDTRDFMEESNMRTTPSSPPVTRVRPSAEKSREHTTGSPGMPKVWVFLKDRVFQRDRRPPGSPEPLAA